MYGMAENQHLKDPLTWNFNWLNGGDNRSREEHATLADVKLKVNGIDVCNHRISHEQTSSNFDLHIALPSHRVSGGELVEDSRQ